MGYWWQNFFTKKTLVWKTILKFTGEGCQGRNEFDWAGKVTGFEKNNNLNCDDVVIEVIIHNYSYSDSRDNKDVEVYKYPLLNADIQNVNGVWCLFN